MLRCVEHLCESLCESDELRHKDILSLLLLLKLDCALPLKPLQVTGRLLHCLIVGPTPLLDLLPLPFLGLLQGLDMVAMLPGQIHRMLGAQTLQLLSSFSHQFLDLRRRVLLHLLELCLQGCTLLIGALQILRRSQHSLSMGLLLLLQLLHLYGFPLLELRLISGQFLSALGVDALQVSPRSFFGSGAFLVQPLHLCRQVQLLQLHGRHQLLALLALHEQFLCAALKFEMLPLFVLFYLSQLLCQLLVGSLHALQLLLLLGAELEDGVVAQGEELQAGHFRQALGGRGHAQVLLEQGGA
mmetsp:Transcript_25988/g.54963  ORF Transcript_25988/g.54963 Transcript_25988/m.54963 type:complete len:299 (+) Transcript_25988:1282-2178(+)